VLVPADLVLSIAPFLAPYLVVAVLVADGPLRPRLAPALRTLALAVPGVLLLNAAWLLPSVTGYRAQYETLQLSPGQLLPPRQQAEEDAADAVR